MSENYSWNAVYIDGTEGHEDELLGFGNIDQERLQALQLIPNKPGLKEHFVHIDVASGQRPIFFRRKAATLDPFTYQETGRQTIHCIGWQKTVNGTNVKSFLWIYEDGSCVLTDTDIADL